MNITEKKSCLNKIITKKNVLRLLMIALTIMVSCPLAFASQASMATAVINGILKIVYLIMNVLGIIFVIVGFVKFIIAHSQEDSPAQQKAAMMIATGLALIIARFIFDQIQFADWLIT